MKILLVDDEKLAIEGLKNLLDWKVFEGELIGTASNGKEALSIIQSAKPDVVISDIKMPVMDGLELANEARKLNRSIHIILLSGHDDFAYARQAIQYGVKDYILKPITRDKIMALEQLLQNLLQQQMAQKKNFMFTWDSSLRDEVLKALHSMDRSFFDDFFQSGFLKENLSKDTTCVFGVQLINYLYSYLTELNINPEALSKSRTDTIEQYYDLPNVPEEHLDFLTSKYFDTLMSIDQQRHSSGDAIASMAMKYIDAHYTYTGFNISYLSSRLNVSISYLSTVFKQATGTNLSTYLTDRRIEHAKNLLADFQYSINEISLMSGYEDSKYFAKLFKKKTSMTPSEYRNLLGQNNSPI